MRFGLDLPNIGAYGSAQALAELALEAENADWDGIFVWDSVHVDLEDPGNRATYDPWIALAAMATNTSRIHLGTMITPIARRRPWKLARETVTLDRLSGGRLVLPVGLGAVEDGAFSRVGEMKSFVNERRKQDGLFDIILEGETPGDDPARAAAIVQPYARAGATWWVEAIWKFFYSAPGDVDMVRDRIRQGTPKID